MFLWIPCGIFSGEYLIIFGNRNVGSNSKRTTVLPVQFSHIDCNGLLLKLSLIECFCLGFLLPNLLLPVLLLYGYHLYREQPSLTPGRVIKNIPLKKSHIHTHCLQFLSSSLCSVMEVNILGKLSSANYKYWVFQLWFLIATLLKFWKSTTLIELEFIPRNLLQLTGEVETFIFRSHFTG